MTFPTFMSQTEFLDLLDKRFNMPKPKNPTKGQAARFASQKQIPIQLRVFNLLKFWIDKYGVDFAEDPALGKRCIELVEGWIEANEKMLGKTGNQIKLQLDRKV